jgi:glycosyltransferase involved in cell wall biosynthesis
MRILHLTPYYAPAYAFGGVTRAVEGMARALSRRGHQVTVLTTDALDQTSRTTGPLESVEADGVRVVRARNQFVTLRGKANLSTPRGLRQAADSLLLEVDIVHAHEFRTVENLLVLPHAAELELPLVLSPHGTLTTATGRGALKVLWDRLFSPMLARHFNAVVALTETESAEAEALWRRLAPDHSTKFAVVPNGIDPAEFADLSGGSAFRAHYGLGDAPVVLFMGRLHTRKGVDVLVRAFQQANVPGARLVIVGPDEGMLTALRPLLDDRIVVTGYLGGADRLAALAAADVFALPATGEGLSMAALEALGAGLPVILSPGCNLPEAESAGAGLIVAPQVDALADALARLLTDSAARATMGAAARRLISERFTWDAAAARLETVYADLLPRA